MNLQAVGHGTPCARSLSLNTALQSISRSQFQLYTSVGFPLLCPSFLLTQAGQASGRGSVYSDAPFLTGVNGAPVAGEPRARFSAPAIGNRGTCGFWPRARLFSSSSAALMIVMSSSGLTASSTSVVCQLHGENGPYPASQAKI